MPRQAKPWLRTAAKAWYARIKGKQVRLCSEAEGHAEAVKRFHRRMAEGGAPVEKGRWTAAELMDLFLDHAERTVKASTYGWYLGHLQSFASHAGKVPAVEVRPLHATGWVDSHPKWGPSTRRGALTALKRCWAWAVEQGYLDTDTLAKLRRPKMRRRDVMTSAEADAALAAIKPGAFKDFVEGLRLTGCRPGELAAVKPSDVDRERGVMTVSGKTGPRQVPITKALEEMIARRLAASKPGEGVWSNSWGRVWQRRTWVKGFWRLQARTGIKRATAYSFRHLYGSLAIERGVDSLLVAELMGHKDLKMLHEFYAKHKDETLRRAAEQATKEAEEG